LDNYSIVLYFVTSSEVMYRNYHISREENVRDECKGFIPELVEGTAEA